MEGWKLTEGGQERLPKEVILKLRPQAQVSWLAGHGDVGKASSSTRGSRNAADVRPGVMVPV